ncbi:MAG: hypothetical protein ABIT36_12515 [Steroidobacteraceae bacterium]
MPASVRCRQAGSAPLARSVAKQYWPMASEVVDRFVIQWGNP